MMAEGYRWHGVAGFQFWFGPKRADLHYNSFQPVCVLCREWNNTFGAGEKVKRTLKVFNDTRYDDPIELTWAVTTPKRLGDQGKQTFHLKPGAAEETEIEFTAPADKGLRQGRGPAELTLTCRRGGKEVFREVKNCWVIDPDGAARPGLAKDELVVFDPKGVVKERLTKRGIAFTEAAAPDALPAHTKVLVVGPDALTPRQATDPMWQALAANGVRVLVLDQDNPLHYQAVPGDLEITDRVGRVAFPENLTHPIFKGLGTDDFFVWSGDHLVYRNVYKKASRAPGRCSSATRTCPVRRSPNAASRTACCCSARRRSATSSAPTPWPGGCSTTCWPTAPPTSRPRRRPSLSWIKTTFD